MKQKKRLKSLLQRRGSVRVYKMADGADGESQMYVLFCHLRVCSIISGLAKYCPSYASTSYADGRWSKFLVQETRTRILVQEICPCVISSRASFFSYEKLG